MAASEKPAFDKKLLENIQNDLKALSLEARKRYSHLKEVAESGIIKVQNATTKHDDIRLAFLSESPEILEPFFIGCDTKNAKIVQMCLASIQRLITQEAVSALAANNILSCLWTLMESGTEELRLLQTCTLLISTNNVVRGEALSKAIVLCFRLHFTKNSTTNNTASATIRQLVSAVFERIIAEDFCPSLDSRNNANLEELKAGSRIPPKSLPPHAADGFMLFQDLVQLVNADQPFYLIGLTEMTRTFGLELLESILSSFPEVFYKHAQFNFLLKERVCPLIIKLFSPNIKYRQGVQSAGQNITASDKPYFPISMRLLRIVSVLIQRYYKMLVTECEIFISLCLKFLDVDKPPWQRALALEVLHKMCIQPELLKCFCQAYDMKPHSTKIFKDIVNALGSYVQSMFISSSTGNPVLSSLSGGLGAPPPAAVQGQPPALLAGMPVGPGITPQAGFLYRGIWLPINPVPSGTCKPIFLELLDRLEAPGVPEGYGISVAYSCLLDVINSIGSIINYQKEPDNKTTYSFSEQENVKACTQHKIFTKQKSEKSCDINCSLELSEQVVNSTWCGLLAAFTLLIEASTDETATENILKAMQIYSSICGTLNMTIPRDAFITALCKASLPPHYTLTVLNSNLLKTDSKATSLDRRRDCDDISSGISNSNTSGASQLPLGLHLGSCDSHEMREQVVAVGTPLPTASLPLGAQQGPVMLTAKNLQCMRSVLSLAHCHGAVLGSAWHLVLTTLQHLVWILGLKPSTGGGSLKPSRLNSTSNNAVITTAVMADLPVLSAMLSRLFESSQFLDEVALQHLVDALCKLSTESMELAYTNREPSLFAVAKLLETGVVNLFRVDVLWKPVTNHLLEVCQHPHIKMREWGAEALTFLVKAALYYKPSAALSSLKDNKKSQTLLLSPLQELSSIPHPDIRQKQLDCTLQILHTGDIISSGWPQLLDVIGAINDEQGEALIRSAFQCLQLVVADYPPVLPCTCLELCVDVAAKFSSQTQELNVSLAAVGLLWNIADHLFQNQEKISEDLRASSSPEEVSVLNSVQISNYGVTVTPFDRLWLSLFCRLGDLCVDSRPAVRKSAGQTLFSTLSAHGSLLQQSTWQVVLWQVLFPLLDRVRSLFGTASTDKITDMGGNILIHHSRNTAQKQLAETQVLTLSGCARIFHTKREVLQKLGDFPRAWALLLEFIESSSLSKNNEVSFSALKSFQEILNISRYEDIKAGKVESTEESYLESEVALWSAAWKVWFNIGVESTKPPGADRIIDNAHSKNDYSMLYVPAQQFLTALIQIFPSLFHHIKGRFGASDFQKLAIVLQNAVAVPVHGETSPFILPSMTDVVLTQLQDSILQAMNILLKEALNENVASLLPAIFNQLLVFSSYACNAPPYGQLRTRAFVNLKVSSTDWVTMNFVPFGEKALEMVVNAYQQTAQQSNIIHSQVLNSMVKSLRLPLSMKYACPSQMTWKLAVNSLLKVLNAGLPVARQYPAQFQGMWIDLAYALDDFLFPASLPSPNQSFEDQQCDEALDCKIIDLLRDSILPYANQLPREFIIKIVTLLNKGSIHSATNNNSLIDIDSSRKLREEFAKSCFETLLQFSFLESGIEIDDDGVVNLLAVTSLLHRFKEVINKYAEDERLSGKCPLPRHRMSEISFVLKAVATLAKSLKKADPEKVEWTVWEQLIALYPSLVDCTTSTSAQVCCSLREALHEYADLLEPPKNVLNGSS